MPSFITHYLCADKAFELLESSQIRNLLGKNRQVFNLGAQGPDIFFFHGLMPGYRSHEIDRIAGLLHHERVGDFFSCTLDYIFHKTGEEKNILTAYIIGFACHYALDCTTHPFIYYRAGFRRRDEPKTHKYSFYHHRFEKYIDFLILDKEHGTSPHDISVHKLICVDKKDARVIGRMYESVLCSVYGFDMKHKEVTASAAFMQLVYSLLRDRRGIKLRLLSRLEKYCRGARLAASYIYPSHVPDTLDCLNVEHTSWCLPWDNSALRADSFCELFEGAALEAKELSQIIYSCLYESMDKEKGLGRIGNRSFSTGEDCSLELEFKYFDCIFE